MKTKWKRQYDLSETGEQIQEVFTEVGCRNCFGEEDRHTFSMLNQLLCGQTLLNQHRAKIDKTVSRLCDSCQVPEDTCHFLFSCKAYKGERDILEATVEDIINREGLNSIGDINLRVFNGIIEISADRVKMRC